MENGDRIVGKVKNLAEKGDALRASNGQLSDSSENDVFEDAVTDADSITSQHLDNLDVGMISEGNNHDLSFGNCVENFAGSSDCQISDQHPEKEKLVSTDVVKSVCSTQAIDISLDQIETDRAKEKKVCPPEDSKDSNLSICAALHANNRTSDAENLFLDVETEKDSFSSQKLGKALEKETNDDSENYARAVYGEEIRESNCDDDGSSVEEIVSESDNDNLGSENPENGLIGDEVSIYRSCLDDFEDEDISNKHDVEEIHSGSIDKIKEEKEVKLEEDLLLVEEGSAYSDVTSENEDPSIHGGRPISNFTVNVDPPKETVLVEDISELSSTDDDENITFSHQVSSSHSHPEPLLSPSLPSRPSGLRSSAPFKEPASRPLPSSRANGSVSHQRPLISEDSGADGIEESDDIREKLQMIRVKFLRVTYRLGQTPHNEVVAQVLYRLGLAEQVTRNTNSQGVFSFDRASVMAKKLESSVQEPLDFTCTIMVIGKTGVGKSATINSIFDNSKLHTNAFQLGTKKIQDVVGTVQGIKVRVIDTPGLSSCPSDHRHNEKILNSIKSFISKTPPDIVLYFDRLDTRNRDYGDVPLLRTVTNVFGTSIWFNAIVVLTHACAAPPDGPSGSPLSYEMFVTQRSHVVQQAIRQAAGDVLLMNPVSLVENHTACRMNRAGQRVLPNGQVWKPQLLLLSFASKILHEANTILKLEDSPPGKTFKSRARAPPLPFLLSSLLQSRPHLKLSEEQIDDEDNIFEDLEDTSDADDVSDYDELPPFKSLTKSELARLSKAQKKSYYEEIDYREKLFFQKQLKEEKKRRILMKKMAESVPDLPIDHNGDKVEDGNDGPASIPVPLPDLALPNSFDSDFPVHRYRFLDSSNKWLVRPVLETQGWDHDVGYEGLNVERLFTVKDKVPLSFSGQLTKDKKDCTLQMEVTSTVKHKKGTSSLIGFDLQTVGKDIACTLRGETKLKKIRCNNMAAGLSTTILGDSVSAGAKFEDKLVIGKRLSILISGGAMSGHGDTAYGGRLEADLRDKNYPIGRGQSTIALSVVDWHGDLAVGCNIQSQHPLGRGTNVICHGNFSNKGSGQVGIRLNSSDHLQMALIALLPIFRNAIRMLFTSSETL